MVKKKDTPNKVSDETLDQGMKLTPEGFVEGSDEAKNWKNSADS
jgi:hypothetical protein